MSKQKGKAFERKIVNILRKELSLPKWCVFRNVASGTADHEIGDVWLNPCCFKNLHLVIECKKRKKLPKNLLISKTAQKWVEQLINEMSKYYTIFGEKPYGALIASENYHKPIVILIKPDRKTKEEPMTLEEFIKWLRSFLV